MFATVSVHIMYRDTFAYICKYIYIHVNLNIFYHVSALLCSYDAGDGDDDIEGDIDADGDGFQ